MDIFEGRDRNDNSNSDDNDSDSRKDDLEQIPSNQTDFTDSNSDALQLVFINPYEDSLGFYHIKGEVENTSVETITSLKIKAHFYDEKMNIVGIEDDQDAYSK